MPSLRRQVRELQEALARSELTENARAKRRLDDAIATAEAWQRAGIRTLSIMEVMDLLHGHHDDARQADAKPPAVHPREAERDPVTGCLPVTAALTGLDKVQAAVQASRGGPAPPQIQGYA